MTTARVLEAKTNLSRLIEADEGDREQEIVIAQNGKPAARLAPPDARLHGKRLGVAEGLREIPKDIDGDDTEIDRLFSGKGD